jgi:hypothetical protein
VSIFSHFNILLLHISDVKLPQVNPPGASPVLTLEQVWAALELKRKQAQLFLSLIDTCEMLSDNGETVVREVKFKDGRNIHAPLFLTLLLTHPGGGVGMAPIVGPKVQEKITHIKSITVAPPSSSHPQRAW